MPSAICFNLDRSEISSSGKGLNVYYITTKFDAFGEKPFENMVGKGENAGNQHFLLFPQCF